MYSVIQKKLIYDSICKKISTSSKSLNKICKEDDKMPNYDTIMVWLSEDKDFSDNYVRAKELQADIFADEIIEIADESSGDLDYIDDFGNRVENKEFTNRSKIRIDARKWAAGKQRPKKYGDKLELNNNITLVPPITGMEII